MTDLLGGEQAHRAVEHVTAATVGREARSRQADVAQLQDIRSRLGSEDLFAQMAEEKMDEKQPNFDAIDRAVLQMGDPIRQADIQRQTQLLHEIVDRKAPGTYAAGVMPDAHVKYLGKVIATSPGMVAAIAKEFGAPLATVRSVLERGAYPGGGPLASIIQRYLSDENFVLALRKNVAEHVIVSDDLATLTEQIDSTQNKIASKQRSIDTERSIYTNAAGTGSYDRIETMKRARPADFNTLKTNVDDFNRLQGSFKTAGLQAVGLDRNGLTNDAEAVQFQGDIDHQINQLSGGLMVDHTTPLPPIPPPPGVDPLGPNRQTIAHLVQGWTNARRVRNLLAVANFDRDSKDLSLYNEYQATKRASLDTQQDEVNGLRVDLVKLQTQHGDLVNGVAQKVDRVLSKTFKDYYNTALLAEADKIAQAEAQQKAEDKKKAEDEKTLRETDAKDLLDRFLHMSFLKYKNGKAVGWDDRALKDFVKKQMLSRSPQELMRDMLRRINQQRFHMPLKYTAELRKVFAEMGVGTGVPPLTLNQVLDKIDRTKYEEWAADKIPDILGYAWGRGFYFDRLRLKSGQIEFLKRAYSPDFFAKALAAKGMYSEEAAKMLGEGYLTGGAISQEKIKQLLGGDWVNGSKKLMKTMAVAGAIGAGTFALAGGLGHPMVGGILPTLKEGAVHVFGGIPQSGALAGTRIPGTLPSLGLAGLNTVSAVSRTGENVIGAVAKGVSDTASKVFPP
ncbi:MAG: hypothetical protein WC489_06420 [Patescibacteria group bacterium]